MLLHTFSKSPFSDRLFSDATSLIRSGDAVLLLNDAVYAAISTSALTDIFDKLVGVSCYAIDEDLAARGIHDAMLPPAVTRASYADFVRLTLEADKMITW